MIAYLSPPDAAQRLGLTVATLRQYAARGWIDGAELWGGAPDAEGVRRGGRWKFKAEALAYSGPRGESYISSLAVPVAKPELPPHPSTWQRRTLKRAQATA